MHLSKVFDTKILELLIAKFHAYSFNKDIFQTIFLTDGKEQRFVIISVLGLNSHRVFHKVLFKGHFYLVFS